MRYLFWRLRVVRHLLFRQYWKAWCDLRLTWAYISDYDNGFEDMFCDGAQPLEAIQAIEDDTFHQMTADLDDQYR